MILWSRKMGCHFKSAHSEARRHIGSSKLFLLLSHGQNIHGLNNSAPWNKTWQFVQLQVLIHSYFCLNSSETLKFQKSFLFSMDEQLNTFCQTKNLNIRVSIHGNFARFVYGNAEVEKYMCFINWYLKNNLNIQTFYQKNNL